MTAKSAKEIQQGVSLAVLSPENEKFDVVIVNKAITAINCDVVAELRKVHGVVR